VDTREVKNELDVLACVCQNLRKASRLVTQSYDESMRPSGLRISQFTVMTTLDKMGKSTHAPLADFLGMDQTTLSRNVELLIRDGMVRAEAGETDRRQQVLRLTQKGEAALAVAMPLWEKAQGEALKVLQASKVPGFLKQLAQLGKMK